MPSTSKMEPERGYLEGKEVVYEAQRLVPGASPSPCVPSDNMPVADPTKPRIETIGTREPPMWKRTQWREVFWWPRSAEA